MNLLDLKYFQSCSNISHLSYRKHFSLLSRSAFSVIYLSFLFLISSMAIIFSEAIVLTFRISSYAHAWLATILDISPVISLFYVCIILSRSNNLVFPYWMVSSSDCTSDAHFPHSFDEWAIACF